MGALTHNGEVLQSLPANASQINFDKTGTNLNSTQTEAAIKEVNTKVNTNTDDITQLKSGLTNLNDLLLARVVFHGTLANDVLETAKLLDNNSVHFWMNSNRASNHPLGCEWGAYIMYKMQNDTTILYIDREHFACTYDVQSTTSSITWHIV